MTTSSAIVKIDYKGELSADHEVFLVLFNSTTLMQVTVKMTDGNLPKIVASTRFIPEDHKYYAICKAVQMLFPHNMKIFFNAMRRNYALFDVSYPD